MTLNFKRIHLFYGWWIVAASFVIAVFNGGIGYGFTAFIEPIAAEFGWSYAHISLGASLRGLEMGLLAPLGGFLVDRLGPKRVTITGAVSISLGLFMLGQTNSLMLYYLSFVAIAAGLGFTTQAVILPAVSNWFRKRVGLASGIAISGFGFGGLLIPVIVKLIDLYGWRLALSILALGELLIVAPLALLLRHKP